MNIGRLGEALMQEKLVSRQALEAILADQKYAGLKPIDALLQSKVIDEKALLSFLSKQYRLPILDLSGFDLADSVKALLSSQICRQYNILPVGKRGETLVVATYDPTSIQVVDDIKFHTRLRVELTLALPSAIKKQLDKNYPEALTKLVATMADVEIQEGLPEGDEASEAMGNGEDAPIIQFATSLLVDAIRKKASDVHIEPFEKDVRIRFRLDGDLFEPMKVPPNIKTALIARMKVMAKMKLDERRLPQDGRIRFKLPEGAVDFRVNTLPTIYGEKVVLRILDRTGSIVAIEDLGMEKDDLDKFVKALKNPWGMCLVTGATGSGKTTTLYSALNMLNTMDVNVSTIEDPVEYNFHGINQVQTKEQIGLSFAETLRALLRQDPDIVLLGEIRDGETAEIAMKAALTGHLVLSTLHTNDAPSTIMRLKDMGMDTFLINSALLIVVAQRLVRRICKHCKVVDERYSDDMLKSLGFPDSLIGKFKPMKGKGCEDCRGTGFKGRCAIHEVMPMTESLKELIGKGGSTADIRKMALAEGMRTLKQNCIRKIVRGIVAIDDLNAAT